MSGPINSSAPSTLSQRESGEGLPIAIVDGGKYYTIVCLLALVGTVVPLLARGMEAWSLFPALVGCIGVAARWRAGFFWFMIALIWIIVADKLGVSPWVLIEFMFTALTALVLARRLYELPRGFAYPHMQLEQPVLDILLCFAVVAFAASFFRLLAVTRNVFPIDRRRQRFRREVKEGAQFVRLHSAEEKRSPGLVEHSEIAPLLIAVGTAVIIAQLFWTWLGERHSLTDLSFTYRGFDEERQVMITQALPVVIPNAIWRMLLILWVFFITIVPIAAVLSMLGMRRTSVSEAALFLQDCLWRETRREQARNNRWLAWAEVKYGHKQARRERREARLRSRRL